VFVVVRDKRHPLPGMEFVVEHGDKPERRRKAIAGALQLMHLTIPTVVDTEDARTEQSYFAWPERLFIVNASGRIVWDAGPGLQSDDTSHRKGWDFDKIQRHLEGELQRRAPRREGAAA